MEADPEDNASGRLAIELQIQDLDNLVASRQLDNSQQMDATVAETQRQELHFSLAQYDPTFQADRRLAASIANAVEQDASIISRVTHDPPMDDDTYHRLAALNQSPSLVTEDFKRSPKPNVSTDICTPIIASRKRARSSSPHNDGDTATRQDMTSTTSGDHNQSQDHDEPQAKKAKTQSETVPSSLDLERDETSTTNPISSITPGIEQPSAEDMSCLVCYADLTEHDLVNIPCSCQYCRSCLESIVKEAVEGSTTFPPTCEENLPIPFDTVANNISIELYDLYQTRLRDMQDLSTVYCASPSCNCKIPGENISEGRAKCPVCWRWTCTRCQSLGSKNDKEIHECKENPDREA